MSFEAVILGSDINAYYMGRSFYEKFHRKAYLLAKEKMNFTHLSNLFNTEYVGDLWDKETFLMVLNNFQKKHPNQQLLLIGSNDFYVRLINENAETLLALGYIFHRNDLALLDSFLIKDQFYTTYDNEAFVIPKTYCYTCLTTIDEEKLDQFLYPIILKPGNGVSYYKHHFDNQAKVYKLNSKEALLTTIKTIEASGYTDQLIIQEFIPGDDTCLFDCILYVATDGLVKLATFAQIGLQEHTSSGVGNLTVLVNGYSQYGQVQDTVNGLIQFVEKVGYRGFCEFDLKYDVRDQQYKVFEMNPRQARSSYYLTALGHNLTEYLVKDLIQHEPLNYHFLDEQIVLSFVPTKVIDDHIHNVAYKQLVHELIKKGQYTDPLACPLEKHLKRTLWLLVRKYNYIKKYRQHQW